MSAPVAPITSTAPAKLDPEEVAGGLTGYDEIAIERAFGREITDFGDSPRALRALAFVLARRDGLDATAAYNQVMGMSLKACMDLFALEDETDVAAQVQAAIEGKG
jgi:hypothetical protein